MVVRRIQVNDKIREKLGEEGLQHLLANLWPVDCQTCGRPLGSEAPSLVVEDMIAFGAAALHHPRCQTPNWNDGVLHAPPKGDFVSWRARVAMLPLLRERTLEPRPILLVNPGLEMVMLQVDDRQRWHVAIHSAFTEAGLRPPVDRPVLDRPLPNVIGQITSSALAVRFREIAPSNGYDAPAEQLYRSRARELGGFLLGVTHALDPDTLTAEDLNQALKASRIALGWVAAR